MSIKIKRMLLAIMVLFSVLCILPKEKVNAASEWSNYTGGQGTNITGHAAGGPTYKKSGWIIQLVDESGHPVLNSKTVYFGYGGANPPTSEPTAWFGEGVNLVKSGTIVNTIPFLKSDGSTMNGAGGDALGNKLEEHDPATGEQYAKGIMINCLGVQKQLLLEWLASGKPLYLQLTGVYWMNKPNGMFFTGAAVAGNTYQMANHIPINALNGAGFVHRVAPNSAHLKKPTWGISNTSTTSVKLDSGAIKAMGLGVGQLELSDSYQVVICVESPTGWTTTYLSTGLDYNVLNPYQGATFVEGQVNKRKTTETSAHSSYSEVCSNVEPGGGVTRPSVGVGAFKFDTNKEEHALFLHYKTTLVESVSKKTTDLYAWELGYRMPQAGSGGHGEIRTKSDTEDYGVKLNDVIEEWQESTEPDAKEGDELTEYQWVVKDKSEEHTYTMSGTQGDFSDPVWNLYRESAPHYDFWGKYNEALGETEWGGDVYVDPKFSYYLTRSQLEGLALSPSDTNAGTGETFSNLLKAGKGADFEVKWKDLGKGKAPQKAASTKTWENVCTYEFSYIAHIVEPAEGAWIIWKEQKRTRSEHSHGTSCSADCSTEYDAWSAWGDTGIESEKFKKSNFSPEKWNGTYASYNIDKYKVQQTGTGSSETAGDQSVSSGGTDGLDKDGDLASQIGKGETKTLSQVWGSSEIHNAATSSSQFKNNIYNLYGEVMMLFWQNIDDKLYQEPLQAQNVYVMSEYERHIIPPLVHGFKTSIIGGKMKGKGSLTTPATGKTASDVKVASNPSMGVTYMGTGFNVATTAKYRIDFGTAGLTISGSDEGANAAWKNKATDVRNRHNMYMSSVLNGVGQEIIMEFTFKPSGNKVYYTLLTGDSRQYTKTTQDLGKDDVSFIHGSASGGNASAIDGYTNGGVDGYLALTKMFDGTMISDQENYDGQHNDSGPANEHNLASHSGSFGHIGYGNWYDEESNHRFCIEKYHSWVIFDYVQAEDKIDYNLLTQNVASKYLNQSKYIVAKFYTRLYRNNVDYTDGLYSWSGAPTLRVDKIKDEDGGDLSLAVINQSTSDMKKN